MIALLASVEAYARDLVARVLALVRGASGASAYVAPAGAMPDQGRKNPRTGYVFRRELAAGVDSRLIDFLNWWEQEGPHPITLAWPRYEWVAPAGIRTDADQAKASVTGQSNAHAAADSPHGHGGAIDIWPVDFDPAVKWELQPQSVIDEFTAQGDAAEAFGLVSGRRFTGPTFPHGDQPHVEVPDWRKLPIAHRESIA